MNRNLENCDAMIQALKDILPEEKMDEIKCTHCGQVYQPVKEEKIDEIIASVRFVEDHDHLHIGLYGFGLPAVHKIRSVCDRFIKKHGKDA